MWVWHPLQSSYSLDHWELLRKIFMITNMPKNMYTYITHKLVHIRTHMHTLVAIIYILAHEQTYTQPQCTNSYIYTAIAHYHIRNTKTYICIYIQYSYLLSGNVRTFIGVL